MPERFDNQFDSPVPEPDSQDPQAREEYGRQLAMESILQAAHGDAAKVGVGPTTRRWSRARIVWSSAAAVLIWVVVFWAVSTLVGEASDDLGAAGLYQTARRDSPVRTRSDTESAPDDGQRGRVGG